MRGCAWLLNATPIDKSTPLAHCINKEPVIEAVLVQPRGSSQTCRSSADNEHSNLRINKAQAI